MVAEGAAVEKVDPERCRVLAKRLASVALLLALGCANEPTVPLGTLSPEQGEKLALERDEARDALAAAERRHQIELEELRAEIRELRLSQGGSSGDDSPVEGVTESVGEPADTTAMAVEFLNLSARPIEANDSWTRFSWQGVVHNNLDRPIKVNAVVLFLDTAGFELETISNKITLQPNEFRKISGVKMVDDQIAPRVSTVGGRVEQ